MTNQQGAQEAPKVRTADYEAGWKDGYKQGAWAAQQPAPSPAPAVGQDDLRAARSDGYAQGVASAVPKKVTADMRRVFREAYREGGFLADRLDYALDRMLAAAHQPPPTPQADTQPAPAQDGYPPLPECQGEIFDDGYWIENKLGPKQDVMGGAQVWLEDQMRAYVDSDRAARAMADSVLEDAARLSETPKDWRDQFTNAVYADLAAADNQDLPLEEYPARILKVLDSIVGPRHPTVIHWRNDAIQACIAIAYKYCRDPQSFQYLKQDLQALIFAARAPADSVTAPAGGVDDAVDAIALARYKVVPAHESMFHRFAVVAGDGKRQLYLGREIECANMARKFAGAFLDGAFYQSQIAAAPTPAAQAADSVQEDAARLDWLDQQCEVYGFQDIHEGIRWGISGPYANVRQAIDYERAARKQGEKQ